MARMVSSKLFTRVDMLAITTTLGKLEGSNDETATQVTKAFLNLKGFQSDDTPFPEEKFAKVNEYAHCIAVVGLSRPCRHLGPNSTRNKKHLQRILLPALETTSTTPSGTVEKSTSAQRSRNQAMTPSLSLPSITVCWALLVGTRVALARIGFSRSRLRATCTTNLKRNAWSSCRDPS